MNKKIRKRHKYTKEYDLKIIISIKEKQIIQ